MRIIIPSEIKELIDIQLPFLQYDEETGYSLRDDAPAEVIEVREKAIRWMRENGR